ncbi:MAG: hypothetical protein ACREIC_21770, partial [Limisphaerales bacterium]
NTPCSACGGAGWLLADNSDHGLRIERCDACEAFGSDSTAVQSVAQMAQAHPALLRFVQRVAGLTHEREPSEEGQPSERPSEDLSPP